MFFRKQSSTALAVLTLVAVALPLSADPFDLHRSDTIRQDYGAVWAGVAGGDGTLLAENSFGSVPDLAGGNLTLFSQGGPSTIWDRTGATLPGVLLRFSGTGQLFLYPPQSVQGFGIALESLSAGSTSFRLNFFRSDGFFLFSSKDFPAADGESIWIGLIDPDARIGIVGISGDGEFLAGPPSFQYPTPPPPALADLPAALTYEMDISQSATYLHEGHIPIGTSSTTDEATESNANAVDLHNIFPSLRAGDVLRLERLGIGLNSNGDLNRLMGVLSSTDVILDGTEFNRVPDAVAAGESYYTAPKSTRYSSIKTPSNISADFVIGFTTHVTVGEQARYLFLSREEPGASGSPVRLRISHLSRNQILDWIASFGLVGSNADLESDLDGDGLTLLEEFIVRKNPTNPDAGAAGDFAFAAKLNPLSEPGRLSIIFGGRADGPFRVRGEFSSDLVNWEPSGEPAALLTTEGTDRLSVLRANDPDPNPGSQRFGRLKFEYLSRP
ncbi:MAG: hypothetical protein ACSHX9_08665 [Luteolibacter sp.]